MDNHTESYKLDEHDHTVMSKYVRDIEDEVHGCPVHIKILMAVGNEYKGQMYSSEEGHKKEIVYDRLDHQVYMHLTGIDDSLLLLSVLGLQDGRKTPISELEAVYGDISDRLGILKEKGLINIYGRGFAIGEGLRPAFERESVAISKDGCQLLEQCITRISQVDQDGKCSISGLSDYIDQLEYFSEIYNIFENCEEFFLD